MSSRGGRRPLASANSRSPPSVLREIRRRSWLACALPAGRALHSPLDHDVIVGQTRRMTGGAHRERWRDGPCGTAATGEVRLRASCQVPTPAEETPRDESQHQSRSEEHTSELQSRQYLVCRLLLEKKKKIKSDLR